MKVSELIKELSKITGNPEIYVYADHGQHAEIASEVSVDYVSSEDGVIHPDDVNEYPEDEVNLVALIWGN